MLTVIVMFEDYVIDSFMNFIKGLYTSIKHATHFLFCARITAIVFSVFVFQITQVFNWIFISSLFHIYLSSSNIIAYLQTCSTNTNIEQSTQNK